MEWKQSGQMLTACVAQLNTKANNEQNGDTNLTVPRGVLTVQ